MAGVGCVVIPTKRAYRYIPSIIQIVLSLSCYRKVVEKAVKFLFEIYRSVFSLSYSHNGSTASTVDR